MDVVERSLPDGAAASSLDLRGFSKPRKSGEDELAFCCPRCKTPLDAAGPNALRCPADEAVYEQVDGIWRFLLPERDAYFAQFIREYETIRRSEGRGSDDPAYYRALPFADLTGAFAGDWQIRARSFEALVDQVVIGMETELDRPLTAIDLGAGNGWLSYRLAQRGHQIAAVDLLTNSFDGLGAYVHYETSFVPVQAEYDFLPFTTGQADLVVFNGSLHYSTSYEVTLAEGLRVLAPHGRLAILDSPIYRDGRSGQQMVREREAYFTQRYGFASNAIESEHYLTFDRLEALAAALGLRWQTFEPAYGLRWTIRPWKARLLGRREPAKFLLLVAQRV